MSESLVRTLQAKRRFLTFAEYQEVLAAAELLDAGRPLPPSNLEGLQEIAADRGIELDD